MDLDSDLQTSICGYIYIYIYIDPLPRRPNHVLTDFKFSSFESSSKPFLIPFSSTTLVDPKIDSQSKRKKYIAKTIPA